MNFKWNIGHKEMQKETLWFEISYLVFGLFCRLSPVAQGVFQMGRLNLRLQATLRQGARLTTWDVFEHP